MMSIIFTIRSPQNFRKLVSSKVGLHDSVENLQILQRQHFTNGMSCRTGSRSMPTSRSKQKRRLRQTNYVTGPELKDYNPLIKGVQGRVEKVEGKITELVVKLKKHSERFAAGKLPARWHMCKLKGVLSMVAPY